MSGDSVVIWSARFGMGLFVLSWALPILHPCYESWRRGARLAWTLGWSATAFHVVWSLGHAHGWSHEAALKETARRTEETLGMAVGAGLFVNYLFLVAWGIDVAWWWADPKRPGRELRWLYWLKQVFLVFIVVNATVIFASGWIRWVGAAACVLLPALWWLGRLKYPDRP